jgi:hypothetical protein
VFERVLHRLHHGYDFGKLGFMVRAVAVVRTDGFSNGIGVVTHKGFEL